MKHANGEIYTYDDSLKENIDTNRKVSQSNMNINLRTVKLSVAAVFSAMAIVLSIFESVLPKLPFLPAGVKLGLSNIASMVTAGALGVPSAVVVSVLKSFFVGLTRGFMAFLMSFCGSLLSTLITGFMLKLKRRPFGFIGIGVLGALTHNFSQLGVAYFLTGAPVFYYLPVIIVASVVFGSITGVMLKVILPILEKMMQNK